jgi:hypothetical protein
MLVQNFAESFSFFEKVWAMLSKTSVNVTYFVCKYMFWLGQLLQKNIKYTWII